MSGKPDWQVHPPSGMRYYKFKLRGQLGYRFEDGRSLTQSEFDRLPDYREQQVAPRTIPEAPARQDPASTWPSRDPVQAEDAGRSAFPEQELGSSTLPNYVHAARSTSTHQEPRRHGSTYSTENSGAANTSLPPALSSLSADFARIRMDSYRDLHSFMVQNPDIVSYTESDALIFEARAQERIGNQTDAQTLIHHALLLRRCIELHPEQYGILFQRLEDKYGDERRDFATKVKAVYETIKTRARAAAQQPHLGSSENQVQDVPLVLQSKTHIDRHDTTQPFRDREVSHSIEAEARSRYEGAREYTPALDASIKSRRVQDQDGKVAYPDAKGHLSFPERSRKDPDRHPQNTDRNREKGYHHQENSGRNREGDKRHRGDIDRHREDIDRHREDIDRYRGDIERHRKDVDRHRENVDRHEEDDEVARMNDEMTHLSVRKSNSEVRVPGDMPIGSGANSRTPKGTNRSYKAPHPHRRPSVSSAGPMTPLHQGKVRTGREIKGTDGEVEILDDRYVKRKDAKTFFSQGRVFSLMWHEPAGENNTSISKPIKITRDRFGGAIFSHILRMVVVRGQHGACLCVPVHTYGGKGVSKPGFSKADREAHSIIYMSDTHPRKLPEETDMNKKPIAVDKASTDQKLDEMSRINFSRVHTVIWNVKVMNVGTVSRESMPSLVSYWKQALE